MTRRALFALAAAAVLDPDRLLYVPGKKLISIPKPQPDCRHLRFRKQAFAGKPLGFRVRVYPRSLADAAQALVLQGILNTPAMLEVIERRIIETAETTALGQFYSWPEFQHVLSDARPLPQPAPPSAAPPA